MKISEIPKDVRDALGFFDFAVDDIPSHPIWFSTRPEAELVPLAREGAGGVYAMLVATGEILFVDSEGSGGILAPDLTIFLQIIVSHPYWRDLLKFSGGGDLAEMRRAIPFAAADYQDCYPQAGAASKLIRERLGLQPADDPVATLHSSVSGSQQRLRLYASDGSELDPLFNGFTVDSNPLWRCGPR